MLDMKLLENEPEHVKERLALRGEVPGIDELLELLAQRRHDIARLQEAQHERNEASNAMKSASKEEIQAKRGELKALSTRIKEMEAKERELEANIHERLLFIPNIPGPLVPQGTDEAENVETQRVLEPAAFDFPALDHVALAENLGIMDQERAAKVSGSRFSFLQGLGSKLNRALINFMADYHTDRGDTELTPPFLVRSESMRGTGQLPKFADDAFSIPHGEGEPFYLIPTAEVPVTNYLADEIIPQEELPLRFCAYSPCFRAEAGAAGKDTRGLIRQHQFEKVEMVRFATPEQAEEELQMMVQRASDILSALELPHRVVRLCGGDLGFSAEMTYDIEVWLPGQNKYREISSCSTFGTFQARRAKIRYRPTSTGGKKSKPQPLVTLNGSGLAIGRTWLAILENHQREDGSVTIPEALRPYMGGLTELTKKATV